ncbi:MAG: hypothetical protein E7255_06990 [Lachnospiraceae bacterium]|jgi:hypothetical protein|nr:hypothetical protein [Lachnospiraceae bacterium]
MMNSVQGQNRLKTMRKEIFKISAYRALIISRIYLSLCLAVSFFLLSLAGSTEAAFYILLILNLLPVLLSYLIKNAAVATQKVFFIALTKEPPFLLNNLKKKYKYTKLHHFTNSVSFTAALLLLLLWQYNYHTKGGIQKSLLFLPTGILLSSMLLRILSIPYYYWKLHIDLSCNRI